MANENKTNESKTKEIDWSKFNLGGDLHYFKLEKGVECLAGFYKMEPTEVPFEDTDAQGKPVQKILPAIRLYLDELNGAKSDLTIDVTSKRWAQTIKTYSDKGLIFSHIFSLTKTGEGTQTIYQMYPIKMKEAKKV